MVPKNLDFEDKVKVVSCSNNPLKEKRNLFYMRTQFVPRSKHSPPRLYKTSHLMLYKSKVAVCSEIHTKHINTLCGQNVELLNVILDGT
jgi:hypothetical protein